MMIAAKTAMENDAYAPAVPGACAPTAPVTPLVFEGQAVRMSVDESGNPWWVARDVCSVLGIKKATDALAKGVAIVNILRGRGSRVSVLPTPLGAGWLRLKFRTAVFMTLNGNPSGRPPAAKAREKQGGKSCPLDKTADSLAKQHGVSPRTIKNDGKYAEAVEKATEVSPDLPRRIAEGKAPPRKAVVDTARMAESDPEGAKQILAETTKRPARSGNANAANVREKQGGTKCPP